MPINIRVDGAWADQELRSLYEWLLNEPDIRHDAEIQLVSSKPSDREMGDTLDLISLVVASSLQLPALGIAVSGWLKTRRHTEALIIECGDAKVVVPPDADPELVVRVLESLREED